MPGVNIPGQPVGFIIQDPITAAASQTSAGMPVDINGSIYVLRTAIEGLAIQIMILNQSLMSARKDSVNIGRFGPVM